MLLDLKFYSVSDVYLNSGLNIILFEIWSCLPTEQFSCDTLGTEIPPIGGLYTMIITKINCWKKNIDFSIILSYFGNPEGVPHASKSLVQ